MHTKAQVDFAAGRDRRYTVVVSAESTVSGISAGVNHYEVINVYSGGRATTNYTIRCDMNFFH